MIADNKRNKKEDYRASSKSSTLFFRNFTLIFWLKSMMVMCMKWMIRVYVCIHTLI